MPRVKLFDQEEVLNKAMNLFWKKGFAATSVQDLVDHLGINRASLYDTFGDKEKLFNLAFEHYRTTNSKGITRFFQSQTNIKEGFVKLFEMSIDQAIQDQDRKGCFVVNTTTELIPGDEKMVKKIADNKKNFVNLFYEYLEKGKSQGQINQCIDLHAMANLLFTLYNGLKVVSKVKPDKNELSGSIYLALSLLD